MKLPLRHEGVCASLHLKRMSHCRCYKQLAHGRPSLQVLGTQIYPVSALRSATYMDSRSVTGENSYLWLAGNEGMEEEAARKNGNYCDGFCARGLLWGSIPSLLALVRIEYGIERQDELCSSMVSDAGAKGETPVAVWSCRSSNMTMAGCI